MDPRLFSVDQIHPAYQNLRDPYPLNDVKVTLQNRELWKKFHNLDTEMIITKSGRRMFPSLSVEIRDLDPHGRYCILLEMTLASPCRHKYTVSGGWTPAGTEEAQSSRTVFMHQDGPATGEFWMSQPVSFGRVKLTNTPLPPLGQIVLSSMHKYIPRIIIVKTSDASAINWSPSTFAVFPETSFIAVTAYQNEKITQLKINNNPFAKGFRENGQSKCKRKLNSKETSGEEKKVKFDPRTCSTPVIPDMSSVATESTSPNSSPDRSNSPTEKSTTEPTLQTCKLMSPPEAPHHLCLSSYDRLQLGSSTYPTQPPPYVVQPPTYPIQYSNYSIWNTPANHIYYNPHPTQFPLCCLTAMGTYGNFHNWPYFRPQPAAKDLRIGELVNKEPTGKPLFRSIRDIIGCD